MKKRFFGRFAKLDLMAMRDGASLGGLAAVGAILISVLSCHALAETVVIHPGSGVTTNVAERISGVTDVTINNGTSGGGIVSLNPRNAYVGTTAQGCGTLVASKLDADGKVSDLGAQGLIQIGSGTFRYEGPDGGWTDRPFTNHAAAARATIYDIRHDLTIASDIDQGYGCFVKTGPGTLYLDGSGTSSFGYGGGEPEDSTSGLRAIFTPNANGDSPTKGFRIFHVMDGRLVLGRNGGTYQITCTHDAGVGGWTTNSGQEKEAMLEIAGGSTTFTGWLMHGSYNGKTANTSEKMPQSTLRVTGGSVNFTTALSLGRNKIEYSTFPQRSAPRVEVFGGKLTAESLYLGEDRGAYTYILITNGTFQVNNLALCGRCSGNIDTTNTLEICGSGIFYRNGALYNDNESVFNVYVHDGGELRINTINNSRYSKTSGSYVKGSTYGQIKLLIDGGTMRKTDGSSSSNGSYANVTSAKIGAKGAKIRAYGDGYSYQFFAPFTTQDGIERDGGITLNALSGEAMTLFGAANQYSGPTILQAGGLTFNSAGMLPPATDFAMTGGFLKIPYLNQTVGTATFGAEGASPSLGLRVTRESHLISSGDVTVLGTPTLSVSLYETRGTTTAATTGGTYPLITAPASSRTALEYLAAHATLANPANALAPAATFSVAEEGDTASLVVTITDTTPLVSSSFIWNGAANDNAWATGGNWDGNAAPNAAAAVATFPDLDDTATIRTVSLSDTATLGSLALTTTNGYTFTGGALSFANGYQTSTISSLAFATNTISSALSGSAALSVNPAATGAGLVRLTGDKSGFTGTVKTGSGTTELDSLAFVDDISDLAIGRGTLHYTGTGETIPGFALAAGGYVSILDVEHDLTLNGGVTCSSSCFTKAGPGDLFVKGTGAFILGNKQVDKSSELGAGVNGDSPTSTFRASQICGGRVVIGTVGDETDAPNVSVTGEVTIGSLLSGTNGLNETGGELMMNNGSITTSSILGLGYYCGIRNYAQERPLLKYTQNGGEVAVKYLRSLWDKTYTQNAKAVFEINGGTLTANGDTSTFSVHPGVNAETEYTQNGGEVYLSGILCGDVATNATRTYSPVTFTLNGGFLSVPGTFRLANYAPGVCYLNEGATLRVGHFKGSEQTAKPESAFYARGGVLKAVVPTSGNTAMQYLTHCYIGEKGLMIDSSENEALGLTYIRVFCLYQTFEPEPGCAADGGITLTGDGRVYVDGAAGKFKESTFTGPVRVKGGHFCVSGSACAFRDVIVEPGAAIRGWSIWQMYQNLTLGAEGSDVPVTLDLYDASGAAATNYCSIVSNDLQILSPVALSLHTDNYSRHDTLAAGVYTALVFNASNPDVDVSLFHAPATRAGYKVTCQQVMVADGGAYDGWKAIVATVSAAPAAPDAVGDTVWTATSAGGSWSASANWNGNAAPNAPGELAVFNAATAKNVPVTLDAPVTVGGLALYASSAQNGYALGGSALTIDTGSQEMAYVSAASGTNSIASDVTYAGAVNATCPAGARLSFAGKVTGAESFNANLGYAAGTGGEVHLADPSGISGRLMCSSGRLVADSLANITDPANLVLGPSTLKYTGTGEEIPGFRLNGGGVCCIVDVERDLAIRTVTINTSSALIKSGPGDLILKGNGTFTMGNTAKNRSSTAELRIKANGDSPISGFRKFDITRGRVIAGTVGDDADAPKVVCDDFAIGTSHAGDYDCEYVMNNGTFTGGSIYLGYYDGLNSKCSLKLTVNGGTINATNMRTVQNNSENAYQNPTITINGGTVNLTSWLALGYQRSRISGYTSRLYMNDGVLNIGNVLYIVHYDNASTGNYRTTAGYVELNGGAVNVTNGVVNLCRQAATTGTLKLNGGTLTAQNIVTTRGTSRLYFNGGTYVPLGASEANRTLSGLTSAYVSTNGVVIDTGSVTAGVYTVAQPLLRDPALNAATADGGLTKLGAGMLVLSGANTYTGMTTVAEGDLRVAGQSSLSPVVTLRYNTTLDLGGTDCSVTNLVLEQGLGVQQVANGSLTVNGSLTLGGADAGDAEAYTTTNLTIAAGATLVTKPGNTLFVEGDLACPANLSVDFRMDSADAIDYGTRIALASFTGSCTAPSNVAAANAGANKGRFEPRVEGDTLYLVFRSGGTIIFVR